MPLLPNFEVTIVTKQWFAAHDNFDCNMLRYPYDDTTPIMNKGLKKHFYILSFSLVIPRI